MLGGFFGGGGGLSTFDSSINGIFVCLFILLLEEWQKKNIGAAGKVYKKKYSERGRKKKRLNKDKFQKNKTNRNKNENLKEEKKFLTQIIEVKLKRDDTYYIEISIHRVYTNRTTNKKNK